MTEKVKVLQIQLLCKGMVTFLGDSVWFNESGHFGSDWELKVLQVGLACPWNKGD